MKKYIIFCLLVLIAACKDKNEITFIPRDEFVAILADIHLADAYYSNNYQLSKLHNDTINFYNSILQNYGYTRAQFDTTLKNYTFETEKLDKLYEDVVTALNKTEQENFELRPGESDNAINIWKGKNAWILPKEGPQKKIPINLKLKGKGRYIISFTYKVFNDDQSKNPRLYLYFWSGGPLNTRMDPSLLRYYVKDSAKLNVVPNKDLPDSTFHFWSEIKSGDQKDTLPINYYERDSRTRVSALDKELTDSKFHFGFGNISGERIDTFNVKHYEKDARTGIIALTKELKDSNFTHLRGFLLDHDKKRGKWKKHVFIEGLKVNYIPVK